MCVCVCVCVCVCGGLCGVVVWCDRVCVWCVSGVVCVTLCMSLRVYVRL